MLMYFLMLIINWIEINILLIKKKIGLIIILMLILKDYGVFIIIE